MSLAAGRGESIHLRRPTGVDPPPTTPVGKPGVESPLMVRVELAAAFGLDDRFPNG